MLGASGGNRPEGLKPRRDEDRSSDELNIRSWEEGVVFTDARKLGVGFLLGIDSAQLSGDL